MLLMVEKGIWGGITQAVKHNCLCNNTNNNKYTKDLYNPGELSIYLQYFDANNRYGWAMVQGLQTHRFNWENGEDLKNEKTDELVKKGKNG